uniref:Uncharacterized protein n=1 Tax=Oryza glumipatula TaxID=40148 RepID=A0A0E0BCV9_9ORYZ
MEQRAAAAAQQRQGRRQSAAAAAACGIRRARAETRHPVYRGVRFRAGKWEEDDSRRQLEDGGGGVVDEDDVLEMPRLMVSMAEGLMISPPPVMLGLQADGGGIMDEGGGVVSLWDHS